METVCKNQIYIIKTISTSNYCTQWNKYLGSCTQAVWIMQTVPCFHTVFELSLGRSFQVSILKELWHRQSRRIRRWDILLYKWNCVQLHGINIYNFTEVYACGQSSYKKLMCKIKYILKFKLENNLRTKRTKVNPLNFK
jgi:hypothetical protein